MDLASCRAFIFDLDGCVYNGESLLAGVDVFLTKPYTDDALAAHIAELMQRP